MELSTKQSLATKVQAWIGQTESHSQSALARKTGLSNPNINHIYRNAWQDKSISDAQWRKLMTFFGVQQHINTANFLNVTNACQLAQRECRTMGVDGYTGAGKSYALETYYREHADVYLVRCRRSMGVRTFMKEVAKEVGCTNVSGQVYDMENAIISRITSNSNPTLVIFDECEYLKPAALDSIKTLIQELEGRCGIIVCGIIRQWLERMADRAKAGIPQFLRRIGHSWVDMSPVDKGEIKAFAQTNGINDQAVIRMLIRDCTDYDRLQKYVNDLVSVAERTREEVTPELYSQLFMS